MVYEMIARIEEGGNGHVPDINPEGVVRLFDKSTNNLGLHNEKQVLKINQLYDINS